jgi:hypothetical protein
MTYRATIDFAILEARGLPRPAPGVRQIPSCVLEIPGVAPVQTSGLKESENPAWRELFHFEELVLPSPSLHFTLTVRAKAHQQTRDIARVEHEQPLGSAEPGVTFEDWIPLVSGSSVHVRISVIEFTAIPEEPVDSPLVERVQEEEEEEDAGVGEGGKGRRRIPSPQVRLDLSSPRTKELAKVDRARLQIVNDEGDPEEIEQSARAIARQQYRVWLKHLPQAERLIVNAKEVAARKNHAEEEVTQNSA